MGVNPLEAHWWRGRNFGDAVNPDLLGYLSGQPVAWSDRDGAEVLLAAGSILEFGRPGWMVWGSGCISATREFPAGLKLLALRGPRTLARARAEGYAGTAPTGDPALLLPLVHPAPARPEVAHDWGLIPHYVDYRASLLALARETAASLVRLRRPRDVLLIDPRWPVKKYLRALLSCRRVASTSLHGLIAADAYGIPSVWMRMSSIVIGGTFKFQDYRESVGRPAGAPVLAAGPDGAGTRIPWSALEEAARGWQPIRWDPQPLLEAFPWKDADWDRKLRLARDHFEALAG